MRPSASLGLIASLVGLIGHAAATTTPTPVCASPIYSVFERNVDLSCGPVLLLFALSRQTYNNNEYYHCYHGLDVYRPNDVNLDSGSEFHNDSTH